MSRLAPPLRAVLRSDVDVSTARRVWQGVDARRADRLRARHRSALFGAFAVGVLVAAICLTALGRFGVDPLVASHDRVPDGVKRVEEAHSIEVEQEQHPEPLPRAPSPPPTRAPAAVQSSRPERTHAVLDDAWRDLAAQGDYAAAYKSLGPGGIATQARTADLDQLLTLADVARLSGHAADAVEPLRRAIADHAQDPRAALAAFTLGRVHLDSLGDSAAATRDFRDALSLGVPQALVEDAYLRLMEAGARSGNRGAAHHAWEEYVERFPQSPRRAVADKWGREP
jgi:TolA-binding protein